MTLDKIKIGARIRRIREELYHETRQLFAERCGLSENHLGKLERGEILISIKTLNKHLNIRNTIDNFLDNSSKEELKMFFKFISIIKETQK